jgi:hypothetical protein
MGPAPVINMIIGYLVMVRITHSFAIALEDILASRERSTDTIYSLIM